MAGLVPNGPTSLLQDRQTVTLEMSPEDVEAVQALIANSQLHGIHYFEVSAKQSEMPEDSESATDGQFSVVVQQRVDETAFGVRLNATAALPIGQASASVAGEYELLNGYSPSRRAVQLFANEVAVMTVFPYLREAVASVTGRVFGQPLHLPIVERGQIALEVEE